MVDRPNLSSSDQRRLPWRAFTPVFQQDFEETGVDRHARRDAHHEIVLRARRHAVFDIQTHGADDAHIETFEFRPGAAFGHRVEKDLHL